MAQAIDDIFPKQQEGIYIFKDPFGKNLQTSTGVKPIKTTVKFRPPEPIPTPSNQFYTPMSGTEGVVKPESISEALNYKVEKSNAPLVEATGKVETAIKEQTKKSEEQDLSARQLEAFQSGAKFFAEVLNAQNAYFATTGQAQLNIIQSRNQAADALYRGRQAQMEAQSEGRQAGESALLAMAVQGQDVSGASVGKIQSSYEAMGVFNGMREEINSIREALGYQLEEVSYNYQIQNAEIARNSAILGAAIQAGAGMAGVL